MGVSLYQKLNSASAEAYNLQQEIHQMRDVLKLTVETLPALDGAKGYDKIGAVIVARADAILKGKLVS